MYCSIKYITTSHRKGTTHKLRLRSSNFPQEKKFEKSIIVQLFVIGKDRGGGKGRPTSWSTNFVVENV